MLWNPVYGGDGRRQHGDVLHEHSLLADGDLTLPLPVALGNKFDDLLHRVVGARLVDRSIWAKIAANLRIRGDDVHDVNVDGVAEPPESCLGDILHPGDLSVRSLLCVRRVDGDAIPVSGRDLYAAAAVKGNGDIGVFEVDVQFPRGDDLAGCDRQYQMAHLYHLGGPQFCIYLRRAILLP